MSRRRQHTPWIQRNSRYLIGAIAILGAINTGYITVTKLLGGETACPSQGCELVLSSDYAYIFGVPLSLFGLLAYIGMAVFALAPLALNINKQPNKELQTRIDNWSWLFLFIGSTAMLIFSAYLMYIMKTEFIDKFGIASVCIYCIASAILAATLFTLTLIGRVWEDVGQLLLTGVLVGMVVLIGSLGIYADIGVSAQGGGASGQGFNITTQSGPAEIALARHLREMGAKMYGAYWCPHCHDQKELFGTPAVQDVPYVECDPNGQNAQPDVCQAVIPRAQSQTGQDFGFPTWEINNRFYTGTQTLVQLADASGYRGPRNFQN